MRARDHAGGRPRLDEVGRTAHRRRRTHRAARRLHDLERCGDARGHELGGQGADVMAHGRAQVRVDDGRARPFVFADLGEDVRRAGDVDVVADHSLQDLGRLVLVVWIRIRVEEADRHRLDVVAADRLGCRVHRGRVELAPHISSRPHSSRDLETPAPRDERRRLVVLKVVHHGDPQPPHLEHITEALRRDQRCPCPATLEHRVRGDGGRVDDRGHLAGSDAGRLSRLTAPSITPCA